MSKDILTCNGVDYPVALNYYSLKLWEDAKGKKMSQILSGINKSGSEAADMITMAEICYYGVKECCDEKEIAFDLTEKQFIKGLPLNQIEKVMKLVMGFLNPQVEEKENKRQLKSLKIA